jgi:hypothetical protein
MLKHDPLVNRCRAFLAQFDWTVVPDPPVQSSQPGKRPHPQSAYLKALLLKIEEGFSSCTQLRRFLLDHPLLVLELGFRPVLDFRQPYGFDVGRTVPTARWFRNNTAFPSSSCKPCWRPRCRTYASKSRVWAKWWLSM